MQLSKEKTLGNYTYSFEYEDIFRINGSFEVLVESIDTLHNNEVIPKKEEYSIRETIVFEFVWYEPVYNSYILIEDPNGTPIWQTDPLIDWIELRNGHWVVPYYQQVSEGKPMILDEIHPLGTWVWQWFDGEIQKDNGTFEVSPYEKSYSTLIEELG